jgi:hypothetical protein
MNIFKAFAGLSLVVSLAFVISCSDDDVDVTNTTTTLSQTDQDALLFMLEEEKLARDTYEYLDQLWALNQFANIKGSEQSHMDAIASLLDQNNIAYTILPYGEFQDTHLQDLYNVLINNGSSSTMSALNVGATIEDLDIQDLQGYIDITTNTSLLAVFDNLQCGSRNHLRSFNTAIENAGGTYVPQYISQELFSSIVTSPNETCN